MAGNDQSSECRARPRHIRSWRDASNAERISGYNGIMLSPHVDALFDERLITFEDDGRMHVHASLPMRVLEQWSIPARRSGRSTRSSANSCSTTAPCSPSRRHNPLGRSDPTVPMVS
jgi:hypothetical protein